MRPNERYGGLARGVRRDMAEKGWAPIRYWVMWSAALAVAIVLFYAVLTPLWIGLRVAGWIAGRLNKRV